MICKNAELPYETSLVLESPPVKFRESVGRAGHFLSLISRSWFERTGNQPQSYKSLLTPGGYPLEFTFSTASRDIRYTSEVGGANWRASAKRRLISEMTGDFDVWNYPLMRNLAAQPDQRFGCWLSVRHRKDSPDFKVYQEITPRAESKILKRLRRSLPGRWKDDMLEPRLLGVPLPAGETAEYYCRIKTPQPGALHKLFYAAGAAARLQCVINYLVFLAAEEPGKLWNRLRLGISFQISPIEQPVVTLFAHSGQIFSTNRQARERILGFARQIGAEMPLYEQATLPFTKSEPSKMVHGLVGIKISNAKSLECVIGLQPFGKLA